MINAEQEPGETPADYLIRLVREACSAWADLPRHEQIRLERDQKISWVLGQLSCMRGAELLRREHVGAIVDDWDRRNSPGGGNR